LASFKEEIKAGLIIVTSLILLSGFIILMGGGQFFEKLDKYYVKVMDAAGLEVGALVKLGGVRIGRVTNISTPSGPGQPLTIEIGIKQGTILYKGTQALITQVGLVGDIYLLLSVEKTTNERFRVGETIPSEEQMQFARIMARVEDIAKSVSSLIEDVNKVFSQKNLMAIEKVIENTNKTIASTSSSFDQITSALKSTTDRLGLVLNEIEGLVRENRGEVSLTIKKAREDMEKVGELIKAFEETGRTLNKTSKTIDTAVNLQSQNLNHLLNLMTKTTEDLQDLIQEIKAKPWSLIYKEGKGREE
jgi:phospholipid/cholesterol/gamma-HCH transport system substrate-binding protein